jgi:hypothetical protein
MISAPTSVAFMLSTQGGLRTAWSTWSGLGPVSRACLRASSLACRHTGAGSRHGIHHGQRGAHSAAQQTVPVPVPGDWRRPRGVYNAGGGSIPSSDRGGDDQADVSRRGEKGGMEGGGNLAETSRRSHSMIPFGCDPLKRMQSGQDSPECGPDQAGSPATHRQSSAERRVPWRPEQRVRRGRGATTFSRCSISFRRPSCSREAY